MADVELETPDRSEGIGDRRRLRTPDLPRGAARGTVEVTVLAGGQDVKLLMPIGPVTMADEAEVLEDIERAVHGRRDGGRVSLPAGLHELARGDMPVGFRKHFDDRPTLRRPAQTARSQPIGDAIPRGRK